MKKNILKYSSLYILLLLMSFNLISCNNDDVERTPMLSVFGPCPALRGGELRFIGVNMTSVTGVKLQGVDEITDFVSSTDTAVKITIPQGAEPGTVTLNYNGGSITTKTNLTFSEPISVDTVYNESTKTPRYGDKLIIKGDYLNLIKQAIFMGGDTVYSADFISQTRKQIELTIPRAAKAGHITLSNGATIPITVITPTVAIQPPVFRTENAITPLSAKAGADSVTIYGANLDLVKSVVFAGTKLAAFRLVSQTEIRALVPIDAEDGKVILVAYASGLTVTSTDEMVMKVPVVTETSPSPVKNGATLTLTGTDLDLVSVVSFGDLTAGIVSQSATSLKIKVPYTTASATAKLTTYSAKSINISGITYTTPIITSASPLSFTAGADLTISGTDLDLVRSVTLGDASVSITPTDPKSFTITTPSTATSGNIIVTTVNGTKVESSVSLTIKAPTSPVVSSMTAKAYKGDMITLVGNNLNNVETVYFYNNVKATKFGERTANKLEVYVPSTATAGTHPVTLVSYSDETITTSSNLYIMGVEPSTANTVMLMNFEQSTTGSHNGSWDSSWSGISDIVTVDGNTYWRGKTTAASGTWWLNCNHQSTGAPGPILADASNYYLKIDIKVENDFKPGDNAFTVVLGDAWKGYISNGFLPMASDGVTCTTGGEWMTLTFDLNTIGYTGKVDMSSGTNGLYLNTGSMDATGICFDNMRFEPK